MRNDMREVMLGLAWGGGIVALALGATLARRLGYMDADAVTRLVIGANGLWMIWYGNRMPKMMVPLPARARQANRVAGWSMVLSGLAYAGLWAFAPTDIAIVGGCGAVLAGIAVTLGYCVSLRAKAGAA